MISPLTPPTKELLCNVCMAMLLADHVEASLDGTPGASAAAGSIDKKARKLWDHAVAGASAPAQAFTRTDSEKRSFGVIPFPSILVAQFSTIDSIACRSNVPLSFKHFNRNSLLVLIIHGVLLFETSVCN